ncbi:3-deoxy-D-manno-octulosonic acid transferase [Pedobacter metabolipauper]|uniref:3-deoxy-D-manno-octulosonic acid transferase n=1 Tax=Pedobacter metabolipauper TaxID=425513 RepID=A0A4R6SWM8_9SPHI|nr:glycosyltransferase N-terminal domain-containing protein [Pedobacter metabolipauper]TDQ10368.1 3-deoxy-D-manno-octulosonic-acid transferase [Pedobacter metabolipauper]
MLWLYNLGIQFYGIIVKIFSIFNPKAQFFIKGRLNIFEKIQNQLPSGRQRIWFHFASLGEFEQGRPLLEKVKSNYPLKEIIVTFFSPSGYEVQKNYALAAGVFYLPLDTRKNARAFIKAINPELAIFTKYEYWYHYFKTLHDLQIPLFIISGIFRPEQVFFKWYGSFNRKILKFVTYFFVQNEESIQLLKNIRIDQASLSGDTRFDRVAENASSPKENPLVKEFCGDAPVFIAGSTWPADERLLAKLAQDHPDWKFIIAPHEIDGAHIDQIRSSFLGAVTYTSNPSRHSDARVLIIDNIGLLSSLYQYGNIAYIGGGFGVGIHNTLEAAAFGIPIIFGPKYDKFQEAKDLIAIGAAISISSSAELKDAFSIFSKPALLSTSKTSAIPSATPIMGANNDAGAAAKKYVLSKTGSSAQIIHHIKRYLSDSHLR